MLYDRTDDEEMLTLPNSTTSERIIRGVESRVYLILNRTFGL
jgi:hypothetical protein